MHIKIKFETEIHKVTERFNEFEYNLVEISASDTQEIKRILWQKAGILKRDTCFWLQLKYNFTEIPAFGTKGFCFHGGKWSYPSLAST